MTPAESLRGWSCIPNVEEWVRSWEGKELLHPRVPIPKALPWSQIPRVMVWRRGCSHGLLLLAQLDASSCEDTDFTVPPRDCFACPPSSVPWHWWPLVSLGTLRALPPPSPVSLSVHCGWKRSSESCGIDRYEGPCSYLSSWADVMESEEKGKKPPQDKFWKNSGETIPVVGTATS